ncbi:G protein-coupled receptor 19 [Elysia marginata]|uniref:G protein-coupled receptor 19 n=1 Tax=Elysia marginata TaxID=1093978 RepID=A0AAV4IUX0_9GAST|nr:G protein-coupled receptor 19 [Elysia marginata]
MYSITTVTSANVTSLNAWDALEGLKEKDGQLRGLAYFNSQDAWVFACLLLLFLWIFALLGNILVLLVVQRSRRVQSTTNFFVVSLAVGDLIVLLLVTPLVAARVLAPRGHWHAGDSLCRLARFVQFTCISSTSLVLVGVCVDRFYTILYPLSFKVTRGTAKRLILCAWVVALVVSAPAVFFFHVVRVRVVFHGREEASFSPVSVCPTFIPAAYMAGFVYAALCLLAHYVCPTVALAIGYFRIFHHIHNVHRLARRCAGEGCHASSNRNRYMASSSNMDGISQLNNNVLCSNRNLRHSATPTGPRAMTFGSTFNPNAQSSPRSLSRQYNPIPRAKVKMVRMLAWLTTSTLLLQLPYVLSHAAYTLARCRLLVADAFLVSFWLLVASAAMKPVIYACSNSNFWRGCKEMLCMSALRCYRLNNYTVTRATAVSRRNYVGVMDVSKQQDIDVRIVAPGLAFNRDKVKDKTAWPVGGSALPSSWL